MKRRALVIIVCAAAISAFALLNSGRQARRRVDQAVDSYSDPGVRGSESASPGHSRVAVGGAPAELADAPAEVSRSVAANPRQANGAQLTRSVSESEPLCRVTIRLAEAANVSSWHALLSEVGEEGATTKIHAGSKEEISVSMPCGNFRVAAVDEALGNYGPTVEFSVLEGDSEAEVIVQRAQVFDLAFELRCHDSQAPIDAARVRLTRADSLRGSTEPLILTSENGRVRAPGLCSGVYCLEIGHEGFVAYSEVLELPGVFRPWLVNSVLDLRYREMLPLKEVAFQLQGYVDWGGAGGFSIAHVRGAATEYQSFNSDGLASLVFGEYEVPVELGLEYPNGDRGVIYLDHDFRLDGEPNMIDVSVKDRIEVDLRVAPGLSGELFDSNVYLQASYTADGGDSLQYAIRVASEGVYQIGIKSQGVLVLGVTKVEEGRQVVWASREVELKGNDVSRFTVNVDRRPMQLRVLDGEGAPVVDASVVVYMIPDRTNWIAAWSTDADGIIELPRMPGDRLALSCYWGYSIRAIDHPIRLDGPGGRVDLRLEPSFEASLLVTVDGVAASGVEVLLQGARSRSVEGQIYATGPDGVTESLRLTNQSAAVVTPQVGLALWSDEPMQPLTPGLNEVRVRTTGHLVCADRERLLSAASVELGEGVSGWIEAGRTKCVESAGRASVRVPVGAYIVETPDGETAQVLVETGEETFIQ